MTGDLSLSLNSWRFADRVFEVNSYYDGERDGWCYELYELNPTRISNEYVDVRIRPPPGRWTVCASLGTRSRPRRLRQPDVPWPVFRHFLDAISASGDIVEEQERPIT